VHLTPLDVFRIAKYLKMEILEFLDKYCLNYCGFDVKLPGIIFKVKLYQEACPFLKNNECTIHDVRPGDCAVYPLQRLTDHIPEEGFNYVMLDFVCRKSECAKKMTIEKWLLKNKQLKREEFVAKYYRMLGSLVPPLMKLYEKKPELASDFRFVGAILFINYDLNKKFFPQFKENCRIARLLIDKAMPIKKKNKHKKKRRRR